MYKRLFSLAALYTLSLGAFSQELQYNGLHGYLYSWSERPPAAFNKGYGLYTAIWPLIDHPLEGFQIGLPGYWLIPDNSDNTTVSLCPPGTVAFDNWPERGPTYEDVFQTIEGGAGYWGGDLFPTSSPKFSIGGTCKCYSNYSKTYLDKRPNVSNLNIAQLSNRVITPYDNLPLKGTPQGDFFGYSYIALPLTPEKSEPWITGDLSWTLFINTANFKGPVIYYLPESWSRIASGYPFDINRGLDSRGISTGESGTMEINSVPMYTMNKSGKSFSKIPKLNFPYNHPDGSILTRDIFYFSEDALYSEIQKWKNGELTEFPEGTFQKSGSYRARVYAPDYIGYDQNELPVSGINEIAKPAVFDNYAFGLKWTTAEHSFPQYFESTSTGKRAITSSEAPGSLQASQFKRRKASNQVYQVDITQWPIAPAAGPFIVQLTDNSLVTYYWYRFVDQPALQESILNTAEKEELQLLVENVHQHWTPDKEFMPAPASGALVSLDDALLVTPPAGFEFGYVPIVTRQEWSAITKTEDSMEKDNVNIYPNPSNGLLQVVSSQPVSSISVFDYMGHLEGEFNTRIFNIQHMKAGLKIVQITLTNGNTKTLRIIKN